MSREKETGAEWQGPAAGSPGRRQRLPRWLKVRVGKGKAFRTVDGLLRESGLNTVCRSALCPNVGQCFERGTATFMILGDHCTRGCRFCAVPSGAPAPPDPDEPEKVGRAVSRLELRYAVVTSVTRDDLGDGGASHFAATVGAIRRQAPGCRVELLVPDFGGSRDALNLVLESGPNVLNHNLETVPRLYHRVRPGADYRRSLQLIGRTARHHLESGWATPKSGVMVGLGETEKELRALMQDLVDEGCLLFTIGQYLQPTREHLPVAEFYHPDRFDKLRRIGESLGLAHVEAGPLVRSSYLADRQAEQLPGRAPELPPES